MSKKQTKSKPKSKSSALAKSNPKSVEKKLTNTEIKERLLQRIFFSFDPDKWDEADAERITSKMVKKDEYDYDAENEAGTAAMTFGFDNDYVLAYTVAENYRGLVVELRRKLIKNFDCKTHAEKALVDMAVSGYMRVLRASQAFTGCLSQGSTNNNLNQFMSIMSKEIDRAHRHFTTAYQMLVQLKQPSLNVHLKTKNAFVAQAQQFNVEKPEPGKDKEIINPK